MAVIRPVIAPAAMLSTVGVIVSAVITGAVAHWVFALTWSTASCSARVVASTDAAAVFSTLRVTNLRRRLSRVLEVESGFNDPVAVALTIGAIQWVLDPSYSVST